MYAHLHTLGFHADRSRPRRFDPAEPLKDVDEYTDVMVLSRDPKPQKGLGTGPRLFIGGTVWMDDVLERELPYVHELLESQDPVLIEIAGVWMPFRQCDVRYPIPAHIRLGRGELLHDTDLRSALQWV